MCNLLEVELDDRVIEVLSSTQTKQVRRVDDYLSSQGGKRVHQQPVTERFVRSRWQTETARKLTLLQGSATGERRSQWWSQPARRGWHGSWGSTADQSLVLRRLPAWSALAEIGIFQGFFQSLGWTAAPKNNTIFLLSLLQFDKQTKSSWLTLHKNKSATIKN